MICVIIVKYEGDSLLKFNTEVRTFAHSHLWMKMFSLKLLSYINMKSLDYLYKIQS